VRVPTFRRSATDTAEDDRPTVAGNSSVAKPDDKTTTRFTTAGAAADRQPRTSAETGRATVAPRQVMTGPPADTETTLEQRRVDEHTTDERRLGERPRETAGPKPRASLLATLGLILSVVAAMLVLSGALLGYGIGVAVLALILSLSGIHATGRRHVAGKSDALIGMVLSLAAIVVGVLALTGSLNWLGTDMQPVNSVREWLDAQFVERF